VNRDDVITPHYHQLPVVKNGNEYRRPRDLIRRVEVLEYNTYDADPEDTDFLDGLRETYGDVINVNDFEVMVEALEKEQWESESRRGG